MAPPHQVVASLPPVSESQPLYTKLVEACAGSEPLLTSLLTTKLMRAATQFKWETYMRDRVLSQLTMCMLHLVLVVLTLIVGLETAEAGAAFQEALGWRQIAAGDLTVIGIGMVPDVLFALLLLSTSSVLVQKSRQLDVALTVTRYAADVWNLIELTAILALYTACGAHFTRQPMFAIQQAGVFGLAATGVGVLHQLRTFEWMQSLRVLVGLKFHLLVTVLKCVGVVLGLGAGVSVALSLVTTSMKDHMMITATYYLDATYTTSLLDNDPYVLAGLCATCMAAIVSCNLVVSGLSLAQSVTTQLVKYKLGLVLSLMNSLCELMLDAMGYVRVVVVLAVGALVSLLVLQPDLQPVSYDQTPFALSFTGGLSWYMYIVGQSNALSIDGDVVSTWKYRHSILGSLLGLVVALNLLLAAMSMLYRLRNHLPYWALAAAAMITSTRTAEENTAFHQVGGWGGEWTSITPAMGADLLLVALSFASCNNLAKICVRFRWNLSASRTIDADWSLCELIAIIALWPVACVAHGVHEPIIVQRAGAVGLMLSAVSMLAPLRPFTWTGRLHTLTAAVLGVALDSRACACLTVWFVLDTAASSATSLLGIHTSYEQRTPQLLTDLWSTVVDVMNAAGRGSEAVSAVTEAAASLDLMSPSRNDPYALAILATGCIAATMCVNLAIFGLSAMYKLSKQMLHYKYRFVKTVAKAAGEVVVDLTCYLSIVLVLISGIVVALTVSQQNYEVVEFATTSLLQLVATSHDVLNSVYAHPLEAIEALAGQLGAAIDNARVSVDGVIVLDVAAMTLAAVVSAIYRLGYRFVHFVIAAAAMVVSTQTTGENIAFHQRGGWGSEWTTVTPAMAADLLCVALAVSSAGLAFKKASAFHPDIIDRWGLCDLWSITALVAACLAHGTAQEAVVVQRAGGIGILLNEIGMLGLLRPFHKTGRVRALARAVFGVALHVRGYCCVLVLVVLVVIASYVVSLLDNEAYEQLVSHPLISDSPWSLGLDVWLFLLGVQMSSCIGLVLEYMSALHYGILLAVSLLCAQRLPLTVAYNHVQHTAKAMALRLRVETILVQELLMTADALGNEELFPAYLEVLQATEPGATNVSLPPVQGDTKADTVSAAFESASEGDEYVETEEDAAAQAHALQVELVKRKERDRMLTMGLAAAQATGRNREIELQEMQARLDDSRSELLKAKQIVAGEGERLRISLDDQGGEMLAEREQMLEEEEARRASLTELREQHSELQEEHDATLAELSELSPIRNRSASSQLGDESDDLSPTSLPELAAREGIAVDELTDFEEEFFKELLAEQGVGATSKHRLLKKFRDAKAAKQ